MKLNRITTLLMLSSLPLLTNAASYTVVELPTKDISLNQFGSAIDNTGLVLATVTQPFNPPIDLSLIDLSIFNLTDPDSAAQGNFNDADYNTIGSFIYSQTSNNQLFGQKLARRLVYKTDGTDLEYVNGLDVGSDGTNGFTFAQRTSVGDTVNGTHIVGTMAGPFAEIPYTDANGNELLYTVNDFSSHGFVQVGDNVTRLVPDDLLGGGVSTAQAINSNLQIAGSSGVGVIIGLENAINNCLDDDIRADEPVQACLFKLRAVQNGNDAFTQSTKRRATIWQADANGNILSKTTYPLAFEPEDGVVNVLSTQATDINNNGVAVGASSVPFSNTYVDSAVVFENGVTTRILEDDDLLPNFATGINDNGFIVGYQSVFVNRTSRSKMFSYNMDTSEVTFTDGFFVNSSTTPRAINNDNLVVGEAESEAVQGTRRRSGFIYDINTNTFTNLNTLIPCDANVNIIAANDINDSGEIVGDALVRRPARNLRGADLLNSDGETVLVDTIIAVKLIPTGNEASDCGLTDEEQVASERQGAGVGILTILGLLVISVFRKNVKNAKI